MHRTVAGLVVVSLVLSAAALSLRAAQGRGSAPGAPPPTGIVVGQVVDAATQRPIAGAMVILSAPGGSTITAGGGGIVDGAFSLALAGRRLSADPPQQVIADQDGRFAFLRLPAGTYQLISKKPAHAGGAYGQRRPAGPARLIELTDGQRLSNVALLLWPPASIAGRVTDEAGEPVTDATVRVLICNVVNGRPALTIAGNALTDDRGEYRVTGLTPGDYVLAIPATRHAMPESIVSAYREAVARDDGSADAITEDLGRSGVTMPKPRGVQVAGFTLDPMLPLARQDASVVYETVFYPGVITADLAGLLTLASGEERLGVDMTLRPLPAVRVSGRLVDPDGGPVGRVGLQLLRSDYSAFSSEAQMAVATSVTDASGAFTFLGVPASEYLVKALLKPAADEAMRFAESRVVVGGRDVTGLSLTLREGWRATGRAVFNGSGTSSLQTLYGQARVQLRRVDGRSIGTIPPAPLDSDGRFVSGAYPPGEYFLTGSVSGGGWAIASATIGGQDVADAPLTLDNDVGEILVTFTTQRSEVSGTVRGAGGTSDLESLVVAYPRNYESWLDAGANPRRLRQVRPGVNGAFTITGLPPGDYALVAVRDDSALSPLRVRRYYAALTAMATTVSVAPSGRHVVSLLSRTIK